MVDLQALQELIDTWPHPKPKPKPLPRVKKSRLVRERRQRRQLPTATRFWKFVDRVPNGCWEWKGSRDRGYGQFKLDGKCRLAHRISWELMNGCPVPFGYELHHTCENTGCVHPAHLEPVSLERHVQIHQKGVA